MIRSVIAALQTSIETMKEIFINYVNWDNKEAMNELIKFIANAPKLSYCSIVGQANLHGIRLERQKAADGVNGIVKVTREGTNEVLCEVETSLSTDIDIRWKY